MQDVLLVDGRGVPLAVVTTSANVNDHNALPELLDNPVVVRPQPTTAELQNLCLDAAFDNELPRNTLGRANYVGRIALKGGRQETYP